MDENFMTKDLTLLALDCNFAAIINKTYKTWKTQRLLMRL